MANLYENIEKLCKNRGINVTLMCKESGASRGSLTDLKSGRKQSLKYETLDKIATYFGISVNELVTGEQKENPSQPQNQFEADMEWVKQRLMAMPTDKRDAMMEMIKNSVK